MIKQASNINFVQQNIKKIGTSSMGFQMYTNNSVKSGMVGLENISYKKKKTE